MIPAEKSMDTPKICPSYFLFKNVIFSHIFHTCEEGEGSFDTLQSMQWSRQRVLSKLDKICAAHSVKSTVILFFKDTTRRYCPIRVIFSSVPGPIGPEICEAWQIGHFLSYDSCPATGLEQSSSLNYSTVKVTLTNTSHSIVILPS